MKALVPLMLIALLLPMACEGDGESIPLYCTTTFTLDNWGVVSTDSYDWVCEARDACVRLDGLHTHAATGNLISHEPEDYDCIRWSQWDGNCEGQGTMRYDPDYDCRCNLCPENNACVAWPPAGGAPPHIVCWPL